MKGMKIKIQKMISLLSSLWTLGAMKLAILSIIAIIPYQASAYERVGRLGLGMTNQLKLDFPQLSFKMQKSRSTSIGGIAGVSTDEDKGGYGAGLKLYRNIFDEPQLNFYFTGTGALLSKKINGTSYSGFQFDFGFGSEFHFEGLNSLGFSFEFGFSGHKTKNFAFETMGNSFVVSAIHFYL